MLGAPGFSCDAVCERGGRRCSAPHLPLIDTCDRLRESVACEAGCVREKRTEVMPFYADGGAAKSDRPALCVTAVGGGSSGGNRGTGGADGGGGIQAGNGAGAGGDASYSCGASQQQMRRLCPCVSGALPQLQPGDAVGAAGAAHDAAGAVVPAGGVQPLDALRATQPQ